jgi:putative lipoic acid-binding regulatory protein
LSESITESESFYSRFRDQLIISQNWPGTYLFKFVVKSESPHLDNLKLLFDSYHPQFSDKQSSKKTFTSLSIRVRMDSADQVIQIYKQASQLDGVMAL